MILLQEYIKILREKGLGLYEAMEKLDTQSFISGFDGPAFYHILLDIYADWEYVEKHKRKHKPASKLSPLEWDLLQSRYDHRCFYCGKRIERLTKDHVIPVSRDGADTIENIVPACKRCNSRKNSRPIEIFKEGAILKLL